MMKLTEVNNKYIVRWEANASRLQDVYAMCAEVAEVNMSEEDYTSAAFLVTHEFWVSAGFSGCSKPANIHIDYTDKFVGIVGANQVDALRDRLDKVNNLMPKVYHAAVKVGGEIKSLCGISDSNVAQKLSLVTCPYCMKEILYKTEFNEDKIH